MGGEAELHTVAPGQSIARRRSDLLNRVLASRPGPGDLLHVRRIFVSQVERAERDGQVGREVNDGAAARSDAVVR